MNKIRKLQTIECCHATKHHVLYTLNTGQRGRWYYDPSEPPRPEIPMMSEPAPKPLAREFTKEEMKQIQFAVFGLACYSAGALRALPLIDIVKLRKLYRRARTVLNRLKNEVMEVRFKELFSEMSHKSLYKFFCYDCTEVYTDANRLSMAYLGITDEVLLERLTRAMVFSTRAPLPDFVLRPSHQEY